MQLSIRRFIVDIQVYLSLKKLFLTLFLVDGGLGQLNQAIMVMNSIGIESIQLVGVSKGEGRKPGLETLITIENDKVNRINLVTT